MRGCHLWRQRKHKQQPNAAASSSKAPQTRLERIIRRKQADLKVLIDDMGMEALEEKLQGAITNPAASQFQLGAMLSSSQAPGVDVRSRRSPCTDGAIDDGLTVSQWRGSMPQLHCATC